MFEHVDADVRRATAAVDVARVRGYQEQLAACGSRHITRPGNAQSREVIAELFRSFGYKYGVPVDGDMVFDIRCLPNPHWEPELRKLTGRDQAVKDYLESQPEVREMYDDIHRYLATWLPRFEANHRVYMTVAIGCTGGQHRSVYMAERLGAAFQQGNTNVLVRHRELEMGSHA